MLLVMAWQTNDHPYPVAKLVLFTTKCHAIKALFCCCTLRPKIIDKHPLFQPSHVSSLQVHSHTGVRMTCRVEDECDNGVPVLEYNAMTRSHPRRHRAGGTTELGCGGRGACVLSTPKDRRRPRTCSLGCIVHDVIIM